MSFIITLLMISTIYSVCLKSVALYKFIFVIHEATLFLGLHFSKVFWKMGNFVI
jgi:hypothetical protein